MWGFLANLIGGPIVSGLINAYKAKLEAANTRDHMAVDLAAKEIEGEIAQRQAEASIIRQEEGRWWTALPRPALAMIFVIYIGKCVLWDKVLGLGSTDPLSPELANIEMIVITGYFGGRTIEKVARIFRR
jgi:hypothetical protein